MYLKSRLLTGASLIVLIVSLTTVFGPSTYAQSNNPRIESNDPQVQVAGKWASQNAAAASRGSYLYSSGSEADVLTLEFSGPSIEVVYVAGPSLGTLAIDIDGTVLRTVITTAEKTAYQQSSRVDYLTNESHTLKVYAQAGGVIGVDAFIIPTTPAPDTILASNASDGGIQSANCSPLSVTHRVSVTESGGNAGGPSNVPSISADGRFVAFESSAALVAADGNGNSDVYVYDRQTCTTQLISVSTTGGAAATSADFAAISGNGRYIVFESGANNLVPNDTNNLDDIFLRDRQAGTTIRVSVTSGGAQSTGGPSNDPDISSDGRYIVFQSEATNLVTADTNALADVFMRDTQTNTTTRVSVTDTELQGNSVSGRPDISANGRFVAFLSSATNMVATVDTNGFPDVFVRDTVANTTIHASLADDESYFTGGFVDNPEVSDNGRFVVFDGEPANLVPGDTNGTRDVFLRDTVANSTTRLSVSSSGVQGNGFSASPRLSPDGRYIVFWSGASNLVPNDTNGLNDSFLRDTQTNTISRVSVTSLGGQLSGDGGINPVISADGRYIAFQSAAPNLVANDTNGQIDIFVTPRVQPVADTLALFNAPFQFVGLLNTLADNPPASAFNAFSAYAPVSGGQWVMGDWNADGLDTPGVYLNGAFFFTNLLGETQPSDWRSLWIGVNGPVVAGRFSNAGVNDCVGAVDSGLLGNTNFFALYFTCDLSGATTTPTLSFQWLSTPLPNPNFSGAFQFGAGDFNNDGLDSIAVRRGNFIAYGNVAPSVGNAIFDLAQFIGAPSANDTGLFVVGDWNADGVDSFGLFYQNGELFYRNDLQFNSGVYGNQSVGTPFGNTGVQVATWR